VESGPAPKPTPKPVSSVSTTPDTGGLRRLPVVRPPAELASSATKDAFRSVKPDTTQRNALRRTRKHGVETVQALTKHLCLPLRDTVRGYQYTLRTLHPFEKVVADLTARAREKKDGLTLQHVLTDLNEARKELLLAGKDWTAKVKYAPTAKEANAATTDATEALLSLFQDLAYPPLQSLLTLQKSLRTAPRIRLDTPAIVLVGAPNVGKSSIVRAISSGTPEVNNYPFTTRGMTLGHVEVFWDTEDETAMAIRVDNTGDDNNNNNDNSHYQRTVKSRYAFSQLCQVMDTPGLLQRSDAERNEMEELTLAAMSHLPTAVMYVLDFSGNAGDKCSSVQDQLALRRSLRARFPRRPWIDVVSKCDLAFVDGAMEDLRRILDKENEEKEEERTKMLEISVKNGTGLDELNLEVMKMLEQVRLVLDAMAAVDARTARKVV